MFKRLHLLTKTLYMHRVFRSGFLFLLAISSLAQAQTIQRPKLVVGIVIDQMRWDYLYRLNPPVAA